MEIYYASSLRDYFCYKQSALKFLLYRRAHFHFGLRYQLVAAKHSRYRFAFNETLVNNWGRRFGPDYSGTRD